VKANAYGFASLFRRLGFPIGGAFLPSWLKNSSRVRHVKKPPFFGTTVGACRPLAIAQPLAGNCGSETVRKYVGFSWSANTHFGRRL
jgi:hypothetical protein